MPDDHTTGAGSSARRKIEIQAGESLDPTRPPRVTIGTTAVPDDGAAASHGPRRLPPPKLLIGIAAVGVLAVGALVFATSRSRLAVDGIADGQMVTRRDLTGLTLRIESSGAGAGDVRVEVNGEPLSWSLDDTGALVVPGGELAEAVSAGSNTLVVSQPGRFGIGGAEVDRTFTYDPSAPTFMVPVAVPAPTAERPTVLRGLVDRAALLTANGQPVIVQPGGVFSTRVEPGISSITLVATDAAGNAETVTVAVTADPPPAAYPPTSAVHITSHGWADPALREHVLALARAGLINAVQLDIKDEGGVVGYRSSVALAEQSGAATDHYDASAALDELHGLGVRVIGRIVCFLDPKLAEWALANGETDMLVLRGSAPLPTDYGDAAFTNVANEVVRGYLIDLAVEAADLGFDEILYDYVRRPEGDLQSMTFPGIDGSPAVAVARFVAATRDRLEASGTLFGVSVFGIAATRPDQIGQDVQLLAPHVDYVSPMVYPSHWGPGEYGVADPNRQPAEIVSASLADFEHAVAGSGAAIVPWLQDFSAGGVTYGPAEVRAQIDAALAVGSNGFLLWNSGSTYTAEALAPTTTTPPTTTAAPTTAPPPTTAVAPTTVAVPGVPAPTTSAITAPPTTATQPSTP